MTLAPAAAAARRYLRTVLKNGGLQLAPNSLFVQAAMSGLQLVLDAGGMGYCEHVAAREDQDGKVGFAFLTLLGPDAWRLVCDDCYREPTRGDGCQVCCRPLAPKVRLLVSVHDDYGIVTVGQLCADCRKGRL